MQSEHEEAELETAAAEAFESGDFGKAIEMALPKALAGDPEYQFSVGYLIVLWNEDEAPMSSPEYTLDDAIAWIRKAAARNLPQAAGFIRDGYQWGRYTFPKDAELEGCWRDVELSRRDATDCMAIEHRKAGGQVLY